METYQKTCYPFSSLKLKEGAKPNQIRILFLKSVHFNELHEISYGQQNTRGLFYAFMEQDFMNDIFGVLSVERILIESPQIALRRSMTGRKGSSDNYNFY